MLCDIFVKFGCYALIPSSKSLNLIVRFHKLAFSCYPATPSTIVNGGKYDPSI
jgi:hypothetical protein